MPASIFAQLDHHASVTPNAPAVWAVGEHLPTDAPPALTYAQLHEQTCAATAWVHAHCAPHAVIALITTNRPIAVPVFLGVLRAGRTLFPLDAALTEPEIDAIIERAGIAHVVTDNPTAARLARSAITFDDVLAHCPVPAHEDQSPAAWLWLQSSGTTGGPKIVRRNGPSLHAVARNIAHAISLTPQDRVVAAVPMSHSYGLENALLAPLYAGASILHHITDDLTQTVAQNGVQKQPNGPRGFNPAIALGRGATVLPGVPALFEMILGGPTGCGSLRLAYSAGAPLPVEIANALEARDGLTLGVLYGATEIGSITFSTHRSTHGAVGQPMKGVDIRIVDPEHPACLQPDNTPGHVMVRAPSMFAGYLHANAEITPGGYFPTGDLGRIDPATGELVLTGRLKLLIDIGGRKVNPLEVETAIAHHPDIAECVVLPDPVSPTINRVRALITAASGRHAPDARSLRLFLKPHLAAHKLPRSVEVRASFPKSATGKILRQQLHQTDA